AARIHVAAGRSGVAPGGVLPPSTWCLAASSGSPRTRTADPQPPSRAPGGSQGSSFADSVLGPPPAGSAGASAPDSPPPVAPAAPPPAPPPVQSFGGSPPAPPSPGPAPVTEPPAPP